MGLPASLTCRGQPMLQACWERWPALKFYLWQNVGHFSVPVLLISLLTAGRGLYIGSSRGAWLRWRGEQLLPVRKWVVGLGGRPTSSILKFPLLHRSNVITDLNHCCQRGSRAGLSFSRHSSSFPLPPIFCLLDLRKEYWNMMHTCWFYLNKKNWCPSTCHAFPYFCASLLLFSSVETLLPLPTWVIQPLHLESIVGSYIFLLVCHPFF